MNIAIKYGHTEETLRFSDGEKVRIGVPPEGASAAAEPAALIRKALAEPLGTGLLRDAARGKKNAVILISDHTRPTPSDRIVPLLLEELEAGGIVPERVTVMVACGLHDRPEPEAVEKILGPELCRKLTVTVHDPDDGTNLVDLGRTAMDTPVRVNRLAVATDLLLSVSTIEPHLFYGWSGGAKNVLPGISARKTVYVHHGRFSRHPIGLNIIDPNPNREDAEEAARMAGLAFIFNVVLDEQRRVVGAFAGDLVSAHRAGVRLGQRLNATTLPEKADILVCALGGSPRDTDFWQTEGKAMMHTQHLVNDRGTLILAAGCENGVGGEEWRQLLLKTPTAVRRISQESEYSVALMKAADLVNVSERINLWMVSPGIGPSDLPHMPVRFFPTVGEALDAARENALSNPPSIIVVPDSSRVVLSVDATAG